MKNVEWKPELWQPVHIAPNDEMVREMPSPLNSFFDLQRISEMYEVRGILPQAKLVYKDRYIYKDRHET